MKQYTITYHKDTKDSLEHSLCLPIMVRQNFLKEPHEKYEVFWEMEKEFLKVAENFFDYFGIENLVYDESYPNLKCEYNYKTWSDHETYQDHAKELRDECHAMAIRGIEDVIHRAFTQQTSDQISIKSKEEYLATMRLLFRNLTETYILDTVTGSELTTGNSGLYIMLKIDDNVDIDIFLKNTRGLKYWLD